MVRKKEQFEQAVELRKRGFTYGEIAKMTGTAKSTVSNWLSRETWSKTVKERNAKRASQENSKRISLLNKARNNQYMRLYAEAERSAVTEYKHYKHSPLFIAGLMLYMSNGDTVHPRTIRVTCAKTEIHRVFIDFTTEYLGVPREKVRFWALLYPEHDPLVVSRHWSKKLDLPLSQFHKYQVIQGKSTKRTLQNGTGNTIIGSTVLKRKLMKWIELAFKEL